MRKFLIVLMLCLSSVASAKLDGSRQFKFINNCDTSVWFGFAGGSVATVNGRPCTGDKDCAAGSICVQTGNIKQCFWRSPKPADGNYQLAAMGGSNSVTIGSSPGFDQIWSGAISGRMYCQLGICEVADCGNDGKGACLPGRGFNQPATQAEFTLSKTNVDFYDIEIINGISVPMSMTPSVASKFYDPYNCGSPGAVVPSSPLLGGCSWHFYPPTTDFRWIKPGGPPCFSDSDCGVGLLGLCGTSFQNGLHRTCGMLLGWWSADQLCGVQPDFGCPLNCSQKAGIGLDGNLTHLSDLFACNNVGSCYQDNAKSDCCGCANWDKNGVKVPASPYTKQCIASNPMWETQVLPKLQWMKAGCPTAYTYPYDDMSSTFICAEIQNKINTVDYTITFCPR